MDAVRRTPFLPFLHCDECEPKMRRLQQAVGKLQLAVGKMRQVSRIGRAGSANLNQRQPVCCWHVRLMRRPDESISEPVRRIPPGAPRTGGHRPSSRSTHRRTPSVRPSPGNNVAAPLRPQCAAAPSAPLVPCAPPLPLAPPPAQRNRRGRSSRDPMHEDPSRSRARAPAHRRRWPCALRSERRRRRYGHCRCCCGGGGQSARDAGRGGGGLWQGL